MAHTTPLAAPLDNHPAFRASRYDELEAAVSSHLAARFVKLPDEPDCVSARANRFNLPNSSLWFCSYGLPITIRFPEQDHVRVQFHRAGTGATWVRDSLVPVNARQACVSGGAAEFHFDRDFEQVVWRIPKDVVRQKLSGLVDEPLSGEIDFDSRLDVGRPESECLVNLLDCTIRAAESIDGACGALVLGELEQALTSTFLAVSSHRYRDQMERRAPGAAPWQVRRAESYIAEHWDQPLVMEDLAAVTGASVRSIFRAFKQSRGYTPQEFAKRVRLGQARRMLEDRESTASVTSVAFACGFGDLGRFSKDFTQAFGERPSEVLNRKRGMKPGLH